MRIARVGPSLACATLAVASTLAWAAPAGAANDPFAFHQWGMQFIGAEPAWTKGTGRGITIAVIDTGVDPDHVDLRGKVLPGRNYVTDGAPAHDDHWHGTHVGGIAAALSNNGVGVVGVAPDARILPVKVLNTKGTGGVTDLGDVPDGIQWAADNGAHVINVSLSIGKVGVNQAAVAATGPALAHAARYAWDKGSIVVVSAGNDESVINLFAQEPVVVVTATDDDDRKAPYATPIGKAKWGLAAPGGRGEGPDEENILSSYWTPAAHDQYAWAAGTSMAAPHVSGAAAVLRSMGLNKQQTVDRLLATARDLGTSGPDETFGAGRLDLGHAVGLPPTPPTRASAGGGGAATNTTAVNRVRRGTTTTSPGGVAPRLQAGDNQPRTGPGLETGQADGTGDAFGGSMIGGGDGGGSGEQPASTGRGPDRDADLPWGWGLAAALALAGALGGIVRALRT